MMTMAVLGACKPHRLRPMQPTLLRPHRVFAYVWPAILHFTDPS
jgi:hypothetical protein